ncbi:MAG: MBL fold metallo-hydrolase [Pyrinomonadaceae bacterium]|nr:MBL fold metallo-hydrolase [Pyrinomonadaceae bacterium]
MEFGDYRVEIIPDTEFRLDGGAMFGVVPRVLWEKKCPPDDLNRIKMNMNCLFIETPQEKILVETGIGEKWSEKETQIYGIFRDKPLSQTLFEKTGCRPEDISIVVNTHLHFDHAGGNTIWNSGQGTVASRQRIEKATVPGAVATGEEKKEVLPAKHAKEREKKKQEAGSQKAVAQFPNARYFVSKSELKHAENPHERDRASYLPENWKPIEESGQLELKPDNYEVVEGLTMQTIRGHSETMQTVRLVRGRRTIYGFADLIPMTTHLSLPWIAGFDLFPLETLEAKRDLLKRAAEEDWICLFYHENEMPLCQIKESDGKLRAVEFGE